MPITERAGESVVLTYHPFIVVMGDEDNHEFFRENFVVELVFAHIPGWIGFRFLPLVFLRQTGKCDFVIVDPFHLVNALVGHVTEEDVHVLWHEHCVRDAGEQDKRYGEDRGQRFWGQEFFH